MKICILTPYFPFQENGGEAPRINNIARSLKRQGHSLVLVSYCSREDMGIRNNPPEALYGAIYRVRRNMFVSLGMALWALFFGKPVLTGFYFSFSYLAAFKKAVKKENPDLYICPLLWMTSYLNLCHLQDKSIVELIGAFLETDTGTIDDGPWIYRMEKKRIAAYELKTISQYKRCVSVLRTDDDCFSR
jgi:hypothetical protein